MRSRHDPSRNMGKHIKSYFCRGLQNLHIMALMMDTSDQTIMVSMVAIENLRSAFLPMKSTDLEIDITQIDRGSDG